MAPAAKRHFKSTPEEAATSPPSSPKEMKLSVDDATFIPEPEISSDAEVQAIYTLQHELFAPASIATDTLEKEFLNSSKLSLLERLVKTPSASPVVEHLQLPEGGSVMHEASDNNSMKRYKQLERARQIERERLLRYMDQLLLQENNPSFVNMEVEIMVPQKPGDEDVVTEDNKEEEEILPSQDHQARAEEYLSRIFEQ